MIDLGGITLVVTGFPRSGTSMMMRMLRLGGVEVLMDDDLQGGIFRHQADPYGVHELRNVGPTLKEHDASWTANKALKVVAPYIDDLPLDRPTKAIFMLRDQTEIITSMLAKRDFWSDNIPQCIGYARKFLAHFNIPTLYLKYQEVMKYPRAASLQIQDFLDVELDIESMSKGADPNVRKRIEEDPTIVKKDGFDSLLRLDADYYKDKNVRPAGVRPMTEEEKARVSGNSAEPRSDVCEEAA